MKKSRASQTTTPSKKLSKLPKKKPQPQAENPAAFLALACERALAQQIYAVEFAVLFSHLERHVQAQQSFLADFATEPSVLQKARESWHRLGEVLDLIRSFAETADLAALDRGLGLCRNLVFDFDELFARARLVGAGELEERLSVPALEREWQEKWQARVARQHGQTRAEFHCKTCGWTFAYTCEVGVHEELELPFEEFDCPVCEVEPGVNS